MIRKWTKTLTSLFLLSSFVLCTEKKEENNDSLLAGLLVLVANQIRVNTVTDLTNESSADYNENKWGLITGSTLNSWVSNWQSNRPSGITGKLVVLQTDAANRVSGDGHNAYIKSDPSSGVYVYLLNDYTTPDLPSGGFRFNQTRDSGLFNNSIRYQANGTFVDDWLNTYNIDPTKDLVVFAAGTGNGTTVSADPGAATATVAGAIQDITRGFYWLRYWGVDVKHLAILNGNLRYNITNNFVQTAQTSTTKSTLPTTKGTFSVRQLRVDNTAITLGLEDVYEIAKNNLTTSNVFGITNTQFLIDARPSTQFGSGRSAGVNGDTSQYITTGFDSAGAPVVWGASGDTNSANTAGKTYVPFEGNIKGAVSFPWLALFEGIPDSGNTSGVTATAFNNGYRYKSKSALANIFANKGYVAGSTVISQCRTNFEAQVNGFASLNILGYPTAYYDGSLVEWTALVSSHPDNHTNQVPSDFKWRTDLASVSVFGYNPQISNSGNVGSAISRVKPAPVNLQATTSKKFIQEDKAYKY
ncbi:sulfurtransferase [Leptospira levettii]|uniref:sulfurtransferase n=1 Tax=Leptospira levettii TaxID=2023178 RepID=UPI000C2A68A8|nr:sulfurtransferase [Leptospira levettii]PKA24870.1 sulfurtransferase [Leptospira sp. mixed culture ATI2-C-A1]TGM75274.1 sulfurtransferase [Leptospira levettii]